MMNRKFVERLVDRALRGASGPYLILAAVAELAP